MQRTSNTGSQKEALETSSKSASETAPFDSTSQAQYQEEDPYSLLALRKRKYGSRWKQQNLVACRQKFDLLHVIILYVSLGIIFMCVGGVCFYYAANYPEPIEVDYTRCKNTAPFAPSKECFPRDFDKGVDPVEKTKNINCICKIDIKINKENLPEEGRSLVLFYKLTSFHQNIRRYKKDVDWEQLAGNAFSTDGKANEPQCKMIKQGDKYIYPCGKIANSFFTDTFKMSMGGQDVKLDTKKIPWSADKGRYKNPSKDHLNNFPNLFVLPRAWPDSLKTSFFQTFNGVENEHFMVWMRAAALATFRKKYAFLDLTEEGDYTIEVEYRYEVQSYKGTKKIVIAADIQDRPVDFFFFYWYIAVGAICLLIGPMFLAANCIIHAFHKSSSSSKPQSTTDTDSPLTSSDDPQHSQIDMDPPTKNPTERPSIVSLKSSNQLKK